jgi:hypothetical protein
MKTNWREVNSHARELQNSDGDCTPADAVASTRKKFGLTDEETRQLCRANGVLTEDLIPFGVDLLGTTKVDTMGA